MKNKNEESEKRSWESSKSDNYEEMQMQNYNPCMYCPMMMYYPMMYGNINMQGNQRMSNNSEEGFDEQEEYRPAPGHGSGSGPGPGHGPGPGPGHGHGPNYGYLINQPVGVSLTNGQGVSGILCSVTNREIYLLVYLYHSQFATKHYPLNMIQNIYKFPRCQNQGWPY